MKHFVAGGTIPKSSKLAKILQRIEILEEMEQQSQEYYRCVIRV